MVKNNMQKSRLLLWEENVSCLPEMDWENWENTDMSVGRNRRSFSKSQMGSKMSKPFNSHMSQCGALSLL